MQAILDISINEINVHYLGHTKVIIQNLVFIFLVFIIKKKKYI